MSTSDVPPAALAPHAPAATPPAMDEIRIYSHSPLFYWWPVWLFGFLFALLTLIDNERLMIVPGSSLLVKEKVGQEEVRYTVYTPPTNDRIEKILEPASHDAKREPAR